MLFSDPSKYLNDAVVVEKNGNEFLYFKTLEECYGHIGKNLHVLKEFAVSSILMEMQQLKILLV